MRANMISMRSVAGTVGMLCLMAQAAVAQVAPTTRPASQPDLAGRLRMSLDQVRAGLKLPEPRQGADVALPAQAADLLAEANKLLDDRRAVGAIVKLDRALTYAPRSRAIHLAMARAHAVSGNAASTEGHLAKALAGANDDAATWVALAGAQREMKKDSAALKSLLMASLCTPPAAGAATAVLLPLDLGSALDSEGYRAAAVPLLESAHKAVLGTLSDAQKADGRIAALVEKGKPALVARIAAAKAATGQAGAAIEELESLVAAGQADRSVCIALVSARVQQQGLAKARDTLAALCGRTAPADAESLSADLLAKVAPSVAAGLAGEALFGAKNDRTPTKADCTLALVAALADLAATPTRPDALYQLVKFAAAAPDADRIVYNVYFRKARQPDAAMIERAFATFPADVALMAQADEYVDGIAPGQIDGVLAALSDRGFAGDYVRGRLAAATTQPDKAVELFTRVSGAKADFAPAYAARMHVLLGQRKYDAVVAVRAEAGKAGVKSAPVHQVAGRALLAKGQAAAAVDELLLAEQLSPTSIEIVVDLADAYLADNQVAPAMRRLRRLHEKHRTNVLVLSRLALASEQEHSNDEAVSYADQILKIEPGNPAALRVRGLALLNDGKVQLAVPALQEAVRKNPEDARCQGALGEALVRGGRWNESIKPLQRALAMDSTLLSARVALADAFAKTGQLDEAVEQWKLLVEKMPENEPVAANLMAELVRRDQLDEALAMLPKLKRSRAVFAAQIIQQAVLAGHREIALKVIARQIADARDDVDRRQWTMERIRILALTTRPDEAVREAKALCATQPGDRELGGFYVAVLLRARRLDEAAEAARVVAEKNPSDIDSAETLIDVLRLSKKYDAALKVADDWLYRSAQPDHVRGWRLRKIGILQSARRKDEAVKFAKTMYDEAPAQLPAVLPYTRVLIWAKDYATALKVLAQADEAKLVGPDLVEMRLEALGRLGRFDEMKKLLSDQMATLKANEKADMWYTAAMVYSAVGRNDDARRALEQAIKADPEHIGSANDLGYQLADLGMQLDRAEELIRRAAENKPTNVAYVDSLAWVYYKRGQFAAAAELLARVLEMDLEPDPVILDHYGDTLYRLGKKDQALVQWRASLKGREDEDPDRAAGSEQSTAEKTRAKVKAAEAEKSDVPVAPLGEGVTPPGASRI